MPLDYFLWGYVKAHVYTDKPALIEAFKDKIEVFIREISAEMLEGACQKLDSADNDDEVQSRSTFA